MEEIFAPCGLACHSCPIFLATRADQGEERLAMRREIARVCREKYGIDYKPEEITDCDGCRPEAGRLFPTCARCPIRACVGERRLSSCASCPDFACEKLGVFFETEPEARTRLERLKAGPPLKNDGAAADG